MVLKTVLLAGVDPTDILRRTMNLSVGYAMCPAFLFVTSELMSGHFSGFHFVEFSVKDIIVLVVAFVSFISIVPASLWIQISGITKISNYVTRNGQILERQLIGALARVYRISQITKMNLLLVGTSVGLVDCAITRSSLGLAVYLLGQFLLIYNLPWPTRCNLWLEMKRRQVLS